MSKSAPDALSNAGQRILVFDFGGGTFDVTIARVKTGKIKVQATRGDNKLGGYDID